ncbi:response regulator transcription factor [Marinagarivorans algicola]|uniref:response regulator transcription factor n=1 Tax=Marinagarivorans algicola TaxID=1513270 RepID=UPI0006B63536|nr:response regulator transcription factor [Marinagarivorans algicola]
MLIGLLEDDPAQAQLLIAWLDGAGHQVAHAASGDDFLELYRQQAMDLAILDWQVPDKTGLEVLAILRGQYECQIPILFSTQRNTEADIVTALQSGADDYLTKPVRQAELLARITALGRRAGVVEVSEVMTFGPIDFNTQSQTVSVSGEPVKLTRKDYAVALCLFQNVGKVLSREFLLKTVWGVDCSLDTRTVDVHVSRVRRALKLGAGTGYGVKNIYQHGYRLHLLEESIL